MKKRVISIVAGLLAIVVPAWGAGYKIPEQSVNSTAHAGAYVAYTPSADAAYYNPANMSWLDNRWILEADAMLIHLDSIHYEDARSSSYSGDSTRENFFLPTFFAVSPDYNNFRFGLSLTAPGGLSKRWENAYPSTFAQEFSLKIFEANPTVSYKFNDRFSLGAGVRAVYADGTVRSSGMVSRSPLATASRDMDGTATAFGYNLAATVRPVDNMNISVTYRSRVKLDIDGTAHLATSLPVGARTYNGDTSVDIPLPAVLSLATSYTFFDQLTVELEYERTFWSSYDKLDFSYPTALSNPILIAAFDTAKAKNWEDTNTWRLGVTYDMKNNWTLMAGVALDETPAPASTIGFELPDSNAVLYSVGVRYKINDKMDVGAAYLYDHKEDRTVNNGTVDGTFENAAAHLFTVGLTYKL